MLKATSPVEKDAGVWKATADKLIEGVIADTVIRGVMKINVSSREQIIREAKAVIPIRMKCRPHTARAPLPHSPPPADYSISTLSSRVRE